MKTFAPSSLFQPSFRHRTGLSSLLGMFFLLLTITSAAHAFDIEQLMGQLAKSTYSTAHFTEHKYLHSLSRPLESNGILKYEAPNHFVKQTLQPTMETITIDGGKLTIERKGKNRTLQLQDYPALQALIECIKSTMDGDLTSLRQYYDLSLSGDQKHWQITLLPKDTDLRKIIKNILISGTVNGIGSIEIDQSKGDRSVMTISRDTQ